MDNHEDDSKPLVGDSYAENSKKYEHIATLNDPAFGSLLVAAELVKQFIIDNKLIIYGGMAIDYALRLRGGAIYPDDYIDFDFDFYSPANVEHSYQLADIFYKHGFKESRSINATHVGTMRVDLVSNHFIADLSYRPQEVFDKLPYLEYQGMRIIHPLFQRIDIHSSLSFPYDDSPREVVFARWGKDIKRFNKLAEYYPVELPKDHAVIMAPVTAPASLRKYVLCGSAAYALLYFSYKQSGGLAEDVISATFEFDENSMTFCAIEPGIEIMHFDVKKAAGEIGATDKKIFEPYINLIPARYEGRMGKNPVTIYDTKNKLLAVNSVEFAGKVFRIVNAQYLLKHFLCKYFVNKDRNLQIANGYLTLYQSIIRMIQTNDTEASPLRPTVKTYGSENINVAREVALNRMHHELGKADLFTVPRHYYPDRAAAKSHVHPAFDPESVEFFRELGREISEERDISEEREISEEPLKAIE